MMNRAFMWHHSELNHIVKHADVHHTPNECLKLNKYIADKSGIFGFTAALTVILPAGLRSHCCTWVAIFEMQGRTGQAETVLSMYCSEGFSFFSLSFCFFSLFETWLCPDS